jgi:2,4-didehydro-3-deoxy-L-rhamnonate hydrolase
VRIARYQLGGRYGVGVIEGTHIIPAGDDLFAPTPDGEPISLAEIDFLPPVLTTAKIVCVGLNYADHAAEGGVALPDQPLIFSKLPNSLTGHGSPIVLSPLSEQVDFEAELGVVVGRRARGVSKEEALAHVFGYTCVNDVSARDLQHGDQQWTRGKSLDTFCPVGPWVVTSDQIPDPQALGIRCLINGEVMQDSHTSNMVFGVDEIISFISQGITLEPGDLIATGTPGGVGFLRRPPRYLATGDIVRIEIDGIGYLENPVL